MTIVLLQVAALAVFVWLLRGSNREPVRQEIRERIDRDK